jgi:hypothetical protein
VGPDCQPAKKKKKKEKKGRGGCWAAAVGRAGSGGPQVRRKKKCGLPSCGPRRDSGGEGSGPVMGCLGLFSFLFFSSLFQFHFKSFSNPFKFKTFTSFQIQILTQISPTI